MNDVLGVIREIQNVSRKAPCKKTVQKIIYLIQEANCDLGFDYSIHYYGPYSEELDSDIRYQYGYGDLDIEITNHGHMLSVIDFENKTYEMNPIAKEIISIFGRKTPAELELLATTLYVQREIGSAKEEDIVNGVVSIKGTKYSQLNIGNAVKELVDRGYFKAA
jgi:uncharacterized protein YwgA